MEIVLGKRISWIDFGKGITIFFVLLVHVVEGLYKTQLYPEYGQVLEVVLGIVFTFIMPVFFALSGYLYKPTHDWKKIRTNILKKFVSLSVPYFIFSAIYVFLQHFSSGSVHNLYSWKSALMSWWQPIGYLWFLFALFFIFVLVSILDGIRLPFVWQLCVYMVLFFVAQYLSLPYIFSGTFTWCLTFYLGFMYRQYRIMSSSWIVYISLVLFVLSLIVQSLTVSRWFETDNLTLTTFISKISSIFIFFALFKLLQDKPVGKYFTKYGPISIIIYLVHAPLASILRILLLRIGMSNLLLQLLVGVIASWYICIGVGYLVNRFKPLDFIFYSNRYFKIGKN